MKPQYDQTTFVVKPYLPGADRPSNSQKSYDQSQKASKTLFLACQVVLEVSPLESGQLLDANGRLVMLRRNFLLPFEMFEEEARRKKAGEKGLEFPGDNEPGRRLFNFKLMESSVRFTHVDSSQIIVI